MHRKRLTAAGLSSGSRRAGCSRVRRRLSCASRHGIATIWVILSLPVALILLITVVEIGNLWTARTELQTNLESAALAGVKTWGDESEASSMPMNPHPNPGAIAITGAARDAALAAFAANTVNGQSFTLSRNETDDGDDQTGYDNTSCTGDVILGGFPTAGGNDFMVMSAVGCGRSTMTTTTIDLELDFRVDTINASNDTSTTPAFEIEFISTTDPTFSITQLVIDLQHNAMTMDDGVWQFNGGGSGPTVVAGPGMGVGGSEAAGYGPIIAGTSSDTGATTFTLSNNGGTGLHVLTIDFLPNQFVAGETLIFGVDTDGVDTGTPAAMPSDRGGDFGDPGAAAGDPADRIAFFIDFNNSGSPSLLDFTLQQLGPNRAALVGNNLQVMATVVVVVPDEDFAVLCQKTIQVNSITDSLFGIPVGPFNVSGRAIATARCAGANSTVVNNPLVVHVSGVSCP